MPKRKRKTAYRIIATIDLDEHQNPIRCEIEVPRGIEDDKRKTAIMDLVCLCNQEIEEGGD